MDGSVGGFGHFDSVDRCEILSYPCFPALLDYYPDFDCGAFRGQGGQRSPIVDHDWPHSSATDRIR